MYNNPFEDFTNQLIDQTYQKVLHIADDGYLSDGTGSYIGLKISGSLIVTDTINNISLISNGTGYKFLSDDGTYKYISISASGDFTTTQSFNQFTQSYYLDSQSFDYRINNITSSGQFDSSSLLTTQSFNLFTQSYYIDSSSVDNRLTILESNQPITIISGSNNILAFPTASRDYLTLNYHLQGPIGSAYGEIQLGWFNTESIHTQITTQDVGVIGDLTFQSFVSNSMCYLCALVDTKYDKSIQINSGSNLIGVFEFPDNSVTINYTLISSIGASFGHILLGAGFTRTKFSHITTQTIGTMGDYNLYAEFFDSYYTLYLETPDTNPATFTYTINKDTYFTHEILSEIIPTDPIIPISIGTNLLTSIPTASGNMAIIEYKQSCPTGATFGTIQVGKYETETIFNQITTNIIGSITELNISSSINNGMLNIYGNTNVDETATFKYHIKEII